MTPQNSETVRVRRAPKMSVFLLLGAAIGLIVAMLLTFAFGGTAEPSPGTGMDYSTLQVFGFLALYCVPAGLAVTGLLAVWLDRRSARHTREIVVEHDRIHVGPTTDSAAEGTQD